MTLVLEFLLRFWKPLAIVALSATFYGSGYYRGHHAADADWQAKYDADIAAANAATVQALNKARDVEQQAAKQVAEIEGKLHEQQVKANDDQDRLLNDVRTGAVSLRDRFTCPDTSKRASVSGTASSTSGSDAAAKRGLQSADADFLIRLAGQADAVTRQLAACQSILSSERQ